ncbi:hypothetical protein [Streptomyces qinzhouensis]|uniref:Uncharacterized protein n=1 Tax=Streptomyces qinzhouensis TaxID=2599401 RepID=A0A5B8JDX0_9ACTN|nr:hypothetical protein [Streptomyces qinzhouensis]QDY78171.1 hypothetical protein FQU76_18620 [Streptomyces qinzhouensis]
MIHNRADQQPRTTTQPAPAPEPLAPVPAAGDDPLRRLQQEIHPDGVRVRIRSVDHPEELFITGLVVICPNCGARRDWMVICDGNQISIRCRCAHQWHEPELTRADFEAMTGGNTTGPVYPSLEDAARATGFDGAFTGMYLNEPRPME